MDPNDSVENIAASLEAVCERLRSLRLAGGVSAGSLRLINALLADPAAHEPFLRRLAAAGGEGLDTLLEVAREANDNDDDGGDGGYPPVVSRDSDDEDEKDADEDDDEDEYAPSESDTDDDARLSDEDVEDALEGADLTHAERQEVRRKIRDGADADSFPEIAEELAEARAEKAEEDAELAAEDEGEAEDEAEDAAAGAEMLLEDAQVDLDDLHAEVTGAEDSLDDVLGFTLGGGREKRPRLNVADATPDEIEAELEAVEEDIVELEGELERKDAAYAMMGGLLEAYGELREAVGLPAGDPRLAAGDAAAKTAALLLESDEYGALDLHNTVCALRAGLEAAVAAAPASEQPGLKRKRAEYEALDEIRAEQRSTATIIDERAFARLVREIGQDYKNDLDFTPDAFAALQAAAEDYLVGLFGDAGLAAIHAQRTEIWPRDMQFARTLRGERR